MLLTKQQLLAHLFASKDVERPNLMHVEIMPSGRIFATNGAAAVVVEPIGQERIEEAEFPEIHGLEGTTPDAPVYLPAEAAKAVAKIAAERARLLLNGHIVIGATDGQTPQLVAIDQPVVVDFPVAAKVLPKGPPAAYVSLDADLLATVAKYARAFGDHVNVKLSLFGPKAAVRFEWTDEHHRVTALVMPMKPKGA